MATIEKHAQAFQERLKTLLGESSQREFARKLGLPHTYVSRYLKGGGAPATLCYLLVEKLGVNPVWLLTGEGEPYVANMSIESSQMAGDLLELVRAMGSVTRMKLGAIAGKKQASMLRELNDALMRYEELRVRLNKHSSKIFEQIIADLEIQYPQLDTEKSESLLKAGAQVYRLSEDIPLKLRFDTQLAASHYLRGDLDEAVRILTRVFLTRATRQGSVERPIIASDVLKAVMTLVASLRLKDAKRLADTMLVLADDMHDPLGAIEALKAVSAYVDIERGELRLALNRLIDADTAGVGNIHDSITGVMTMYGLFLRGSVAIDDLWDTTLLPAALLPRMALIALWLDDGRILHRLAKAFPAVGKRIEMPQVSLLGFYVERMAQLHHDARGFSMRAFESGLEVLRGQGMPASIVQHTEHIVRTRIALGLNRRSLALASCEQAQATLDRDAETICAPLLMRALHHRSALILFSSDAKSRSSRPAYKAAEAFFRSHLAAGYNCFRGVLDEVR